MDEKKNEQQKSGMGGSQETERKNVQQGGEQIGGQQRSDQQQPSTIKEDKQNLNK